ncbi:proton-coupled amino acid transporter 4 [Elysia marginata]|uniref:Proton-coupled amino acid transporter 4 n=1 Tax=Elysia marginata TaxID=1093978 RepID=A0AAV4FI96_9GAST|nr:proton-coupled amino acid transporter 4 [Elysia marginata]
MQFDDGDKNRSPVHVHGMGVATTAVFIVGEVAGSGVLALPKALNDTGWIGVVLMVLIAGVAVYTGTLLGRCWMIVLERHASGLDHKARQPYPSIGQAAFGKHCRQLAVIAALATAIACLMVLIQMATDAPEMPPAFHGPLVPKEFFAAFGIISFGFGGHHSFPTFQVDMKKPERFGYTLSISYFTILAIYMPVVISGFLLYGDNLQANVLLNITTGPLLTVAQILITLHLMAGAVILINPLCQESEDLLGIPSRFGLRRVLLRTALMGLALFTALTLPKFGAILSLIGGSTLTCMGFIFPPLFYLKLCSMKGNWENK